jgi:hypothetical protein
MEIKLLEGPMGLDSALMGLGLNFFLTSGYSCWADVPAEEHERIRKVACRLAPKGNGENKFLRAIHYSWLIRAPRYWFQELATYGVGTVTQSESTMRILAMGRSFEPRDFEGEVDPWVLAKLNILLDCLRANPKATDLLLQIKGRLPESFLQRRVWSCSLAVMQNVAMQRRQHRLPLWHDVCRAFAEATPSWLRESVYHGYL